MLGLLRATGVLCVYGSGFGLPPTDGYLRIVFLASPDELHDDLPADGGVHGGLPAVERPSAIARAVAVDRARRSWSLWALYLARDALLLIYISVLLAIGLGPLVHRIEQRSCRAAGVCRAGSPSSSSTLASSAS